MQGAGFEVQDLGLTVEVGFWLMHMLPLSFAGESLPAEAQRSLFHRDPVTDAYSPP